MTRYAAIQSAETMAFLRAVVAGEKDLAVTSEDRLAKHFLGRKYRLLVSVGVQALPQTNPGVCRAGELWLHHRSHPAL